MGSLEQNMLKSRVIKSGYLLDQSIYKSFTPLIGQFIGFTFRREFDNPKVIGAVQAEKALAKFSGILVVLSYAYLNIFKQVKFNKI